MQVENMQSFIKHKRNGISANILRSECIQLRAKDFSQRRIEDMLKVSRNTVAKVFTLLKYALF